MPAPSALTTLIAKTNSNADPVSALTTQVFHNLQHQHLWTSLETHHPQNNQTALLQEQQNQEVAASVSGLPVPLISGIPPHRMYTHPDEQLYLLEIGLREGDLPSERLWVLPTTQGQSWSLQKLSAVFDALPSPSFSSLSGSEATRDDNKDKDREAKLTQYFERRRRADERNEWGGKRLILAMVDRLVGGDGTVVYYVVHDGHVKPRQN
ncbi:hypothetical protein UA08_04201 [Talaromyces atroroseus]|uniref:tRNA-splicing endonuclease subunit Sen15 domain-containing protein n=1 Tax=Talaromyces atroroseus TaxID=1441469 RepID=A0A1Q5Q8R4_TALAT|nr:hypothetical protein UA08_04201 [Talaromyces atroroseus]OKL60528.1 hypothetical protein UA08_04201 [Talaromyces atroroseus]